jgi:hypothetical protein
MKGCRWLRSVALAVGVALTVAVTGLPAAAIDTPPGSKNFAPPRNVPNYFSNESGSFNGGAGARPLASGSVPAFAGPAPSRGSAAVASRGYARHYAGRGTRGRGHSRYVRGRASVRGHAYAARGSRTSPGRASAGHGRASASAGGRVARR